MNIMMFIVAIVPAMIGILMVRSTARWILAAGLALPIPVSLLTWGMGTEALTGLSVLILIVVTAILVARTWQPGLLAPTTLLVFFTIFGVVLPALPLGPIVSATIDNPWDELCSGQSDTCPSDPVVWANFLLGLWTLIVCFFTIPALVVWQMSLLLKKRRELRRDWHASKPMR